MSIISEALKKVEKTNKLIANGFKGSQSISSQSTATFEEPTVSVQEVKVKERTPAEIAEKPPLTVTRPAKPPLTPIESGTALSLSRLGSRAKPSRSAFEKNQPLAWKINIWVVLAVSALACLALSGVIYWMKEMPGDYALIEQAVSQVPPPAAQIESVMTTAAAVAIHSPYRLTGIYALNDHERYAFINDEVVQVGSIINKAKLTAVEEDRVILQRGRKTIVLKLR